MGIQRIHDNDYIQVTHKIYSEKLFKIWNAIKYF